MTAGIGSIVLDLIHQYGYLALFVYLVLETAFILHFAPSELVVPVAASILVHGPLSFALFVLDATAGATLGSLLLYGLFDRYGERTLDRYGRYFHLTEANVDRSRRWFQRWGESTVLWGRFLPLVRAVISIPAGIAHMERRKFAVYSAGGSGLFAAAVAGLVLTGREVLPSKVLFAWLTTGFRRVMAMALSNPVFAIAALGLVLFVALLVRNAVAKHIGSPTGG